MTPMRIHISISSSQISQDISLASARGPFVSYDGVADVLLRGYSASSGGLRPILSESARLTCDTRRDSSSCGSSLFEAAMGAELRMRIRWMAKAE